MSLPASSTTRPEPRAAFSENPVYLSVGLAAHVLRIEHHKRHRIPRMDPPRNRGRMIGHQEHSPFGNCSRPASMGPTTFASKSSMAVIFRSSRPEWDVSSGASR